jgi:hypothetical protein
MALLLGPQHEIAKALLKQAVTGCLSLVKFLLSICIMLTWTAWTVLAARSLDRAYA